MRKHTVDELKDASEQLEGKLDDLRGTLSSEDASALDEMLSIAKDHAEEISSEQLAVIEAGVGAKPMSTHM